jgi:formate C-acetyltransferase
MEFDTLKLTGQRWEEQIDVRDFVQQNYTPYTGGADFLEGPTKRTEDLWRQSSELLKKERENDGVLAIDTETVAEIPMEESEWPVRQQKPTAKKLIPK